jgi:hypothetical protein
MTRPIVAILALTGLSPAQGKQTFTGVITDNVCSTADHSHMQMGPTDAECVTACVSEHGAAYVLHDGKNVYELSDEKTPERFTARKAKILGTLDGRFRWTRSARQNEPRRASLSTSALRGFAGVNHAEQGMLPCWAR